MKNLLILAASFIAYYSCATISSPSIGSELQLKASFKGTYTFYPCNSGNFYLVEVRLVNNTDSTFSFVANSCLTSSIIITEPEGIEICPNACSENSQSLIKLNPHEEFSLPIILTVNRNKDLNYKNIKIGIVLLQSREGMFLREGFRSIIERMKNYKENILWSEPILIEPTGGRTYEIK